MRSDNGTEFMCLARFFRENGILHQTSCVATPQQNERVERKHRHILNVSRALLFQASLHIKFWGEAILSAVYLINRTPSAILKHKSPFEVLHESQPSYDQLKVFGCLCFVHHRARDKDKFSYRSRRCIFVGYPYNQKGWKVYDLDKKEFLISRDVIFHEDKFPFATEVITSSKPSKILPVVSLSSDDDWLVQELPTQVERGSNNDSAVTSSSLADPVSPSTSHPVETQTEYSVSSVPQSGPHDQSPAASTDVAPVSASMEESVYVPEKESLGRGLRNRAPPAKFQDYVSHNVQCIEDTEETHLVPICSSSSSSEIIQGKIQYPMCNYVYAIFRVA